MYYQDGPNDVITKVLIRGMQEFQSQKEGHGMMEAEFGVMHPEDGRKGHKPKNAGGL